MQDVETSRGCMTAEKDVFQDDVVGKVGRGNDLVEQYSQK